MRNYYINHITKEVTEEAIGTHSEHIGSFSTIQDFETALAIKTKSYCEGNDQLIDIGEFKMPKNTPSYNVWEELSGDGLNLLIWLYVRQKELRDQLELQFRAKHLS